MNREDEPTDARHDRPASSVPMLFLLLGAALVAVVLVGGVGFYLTLRVRNAERTALAEAEMMRVEAVRAEAEVAARRADGAFRWPAGEALNPPGGEQLDPIPVNLSTVSVNKAARLLGQRVLVTYDLLDNEDGRGGFVVYSNDGPDSDEENDVERSVWVPKGRRVGTKGAALGTLTVVHHPAAVGADGTEFPAWVEVRAVLDP